MINLFFIVFNCLLFSTKIDDMGLSHVLLYHRFVTFPPLPKTPLGEFCTVIWVRSHWLLRLPWFILSERGLSIWPKHLGIIFISALYRKGISVSSNVAISLLKTQWFFHPFFLCWIKREQRLYVNMPDTRARGKQYVPWCCSAPNLLKLYKLFGERHSIQPICACLWEGVNVCIC